MWRVWRRTCELIALSAVRCLDGVVSDVSADKFENVICLTQDVSHSS